MTMKDIACTTVLAAGLILIVDSQLYENPMHYRPEPHNGLGRILHGRWVRGAELGAGIALILGTMGAGLFMLWNTKRTKRGTQRTPPCDAAARAAQEK